VEEKYMKGKYQTKRKL